MEEGVGEDEAPEQPADGEGVNKVVKPANNLDASSSKSSRKLWVGLGLLVLTALALGLGLGLGLDKDDDDKDSSDSSNTSPGDPDNSNSSNSNNSNNNDDANNVDINLNNNSNLLRGKSLPPLSSATIRETYTSCDALTDDLNTAVLYLAEATIEGNIQWFFHDNWSYRGGGGGFLPVDADFGDAIPEEGGAPESSSSQAEGGDDIATNEDSFGTNNQVEGVDEADLLKSNGNQAFVVYGRDIVELNIEQNQVQTRTTLPDTTTTGGTAGSDFCGGGGSIDGMLLIDDRLIVFAREYTYYCGGDFPEATLDEEPFTSSTTSSSTSQPIVQGDGATKVLIYDTTTMALVSTEELAGSYISARSIDNNVYVVTSNWINTYPFTQHLDPYNQDIYGADFTEDQYRTMAQAEATSRAGAFVDQLVGELDCNSIQPIALLQNSADALSFGGGVMESLVNVHSFSVDGDATGINLNTRSMMLPSAGWNVYASQNFLVLAGEGYNVDILPAADTEGEDDSDTSVGQETYVIVYELEGDSIADVKIGSVPGYTLNQFAIDQYRQVNPVSQTEVDYLRIASCTRERWWWGPEAWEATEEALCEVNVLEISDQMPIVGTAGELGHPGERIYSVRFQGDRGFVVTFRETDPFYTLDLSDPTNPQAVGELEIPGFSNYLHPVGDNSILGVGQAVEDGVTVGLQISLFDVSNFAAPERVWNYIEADGSYSDAQYDHRGFRYLQDSGILILPLTIYGDYGASNGLDGFRLYSVDLLTAPGIEPYLTIEHGVGDFYEYGCWSYTGYLASRSIVVGGSLRTFKGHTIVAYNLSDRTPIGLPINLDEGLTPEDCSPYYFGGADF